MTEALKPCPFCGSDAAKITYGHGTYEPGCTHCGTFIGIYSSERSAIAAWNRRAISGVAAPAGASQQLGNAEYDSWQPTSFRTAYVRHLERGLAGWKDEAERARSAAAAAMEELQALWQHQRGDVWYWQGDGTDHPESMSNSMVVVMRAPALRRILSGAPAVAKPLTDLLTLCECAYYNHLRAMSLQEEGRPGFDEKFVASCKKTHDLARAKLMAFVAHGIGSPSANAGEVDHG